MQKASTAKGSPVNVLDLFADEARLPAPGEREDVAESAGFGEDGETAVEEQEQAEKEGRLSKRADLLKMHAYRDAIRRSEGAYVLYPGTHEKRWAAYHELLPGIGAFPVCPGSNDDMKNVADFLKKAADLCVDRFSQLYRQRYWTENIMADPPGAYQGWVPPELKTPPLDTGVVLGFIRRGATEVCRDQGIFYFHAVDKNRQPIYFDPRILTARYLVPFSSASAPGGGGHASTQWLDWWAEIESISMVHRHSLGKYPGLYGQLNSAMNVEYYYLANLKRQDDGTFVRHYGTGTPPPSNPAPTPRRPRFATWRDLQGGWRST